MRRSHLSAIALSLLILPLCSLGMLAEGDVGQGKAAFMKRCKMCHGADGQGNPAIARMLKVEFKALDSDYVQKKPDSEFKEIILNGKGKMAAVRGTDDAEIENIVAYVRSLKKTE